MTNDKVPLEQGRVLWGYVNFISLLTLFQLMNISMLKKLFYVCFTITFGQRIFKNYEDYNSQSLYRILDDFESLNFLPSEEPNTI